LISKKLAARRKMDVFSTDDIIIAREKRPITKIFEASGEAYFRKIEKEVVRDVSQKKDVIIDCGGGVVLDPENIAVLKTNGIVFYLSATPKEIHARLHHETHRPLLKVDNPEARIEDLLAKREAFYAQADYTIDTNKKSPGQICEEINDIVDQERNS